MKFDLCSRRGATSVFLTMILACMLVATGLFVHAASQLAGRSCADAVFDLAGRSVLSEYDLQLQNRYGLFAVHTDESQAESKIKYYADYSFHDNGMKEALRGRDYTDVLRLGLDSVHVSLKGYSMTDTELFEQQLLDHMKTGIVTDKLKAGRTQEKTEHPQDQETVLRNEQIINSLPSSGYKSGIFSDLGRIAENGLPGLGEIKRNGGNTYLVDEYIMSHFFSHRSGSDERSVFFLNEVEYILKGNLSDAENYSGVRRDLFLMRNVLNLNHIKNDPAKMNEVEAVAIALTAGQGKEIGTLAVMEAWAAAEAENDLRLLEDGKQVALIKGGDDWALPISSTLEYLWKDGYTEPKRTTGYDYEAYLRILLFLEDREKKLLRCMDLIQIDMKGNHDCDFDLKEYYGGFHFEAVVQGKKFTYDEKY